MAAYANKTMFVCDAPCNMLTTSFFIHDTQNKCKPFEIINCLTSQNCSDMFIRLTYIRKGENICEKDLLYGNTHFLIYNCLIFILQMFLLLFLVAGILLPSLRI